MTEGKYSVKTKHILLVLGVLLAVCAGLSALFLMPKQPAVTARVTSGGQVVRIVNLSENQTFTITAPNGGTNTVTVREGKIAVTEATCPDHVCMDMGWRQSGVPIACLPNQLIISFSEDGGLDAMAG